MGILNKLMFWKREDEFGFDDLANKEMEKSGLPQDDPGTENKDSLGLNEKSPFDDTTTPSLSGSDPLNPAGTSNNPLPPHLQEGAHSPPMQDNMPMGNQQGPQPAPGISNKRELELISSKLDTIKALMNSMDQRIANLEKAAGVQQQQKENLW